MLQATAVGGRNSANMQEYLEKHWTEGLSEEEAIKLTVKTLLEVSGHKAYLMTGQVLHIQRVSDSS